MARCQRRQGICGRVLPVDESIARRAAALHVPDPAPFRDALIGATALVHGLAMVTRNVRDFERYRGLLGALIVALTG